MFGQLKTHIDRRIQITPHEFDVFCSAIETKYLRKKDTLVRAGEICRAQAYINVGCLKSYYTDDQLREHVIHIGFEDWWLSDLKSFFTGNFADFTVEAIEDSEIFLIDQTAYQNILHTIPVFERFFRLLIQSGYAALQQRMVDQMSLNAEGRYLSLIKKFPTMERRVPQHTIASYLGITPEALSRIRKSLIDKQRKKAI